MKVVFFGTPEYVIPIAEALKKTFNTSKERGLVAVVTQPPKPVGRDKKLTFSAVDTWAFKHKVEIIKDLKLQEIPPADLGIVAAYGNLIPQDIIDSFPLGILNVHPSLLPNLRGASPIQSAIAMGLTQTGLSIIKMDEKMDHGAIVSQFKEEIMSDDNAVSLRKRMFDRSVDFLINLIPNYVNGKIILKRQEDEKATLTQTITKEDGFLPPLFLKAAIAGKNLETKWELKFVKKYSQNPTPLTVFNFIRALAGWPGAWTTVSISKESKTPKRLKIKKAHLEKTDENTDSLVLDLVQLEGKNEVTWKEFIAGYPHFSFE